MDELALLRIDKINEITYFYQKDFNKFYSTLIGLVEIIPNQVNNEIRNAFAHLVRINLVKTELEIIDEASKAIGHIERACRDCLKICIAQTHDKVNLQCDYALTYHKAISPQHISEKKWFVEERKNISLAETNGEKELTNRLEELLDRMLGLQEALEEQYGLQPSETSKIKLLLTQWFGAGVAGGIAGLIKLVIAFAIGWLVKYFEII